MEILNLKTFKEKIFDFENDKDWKFKGSKPTIIDFYADWCGPCHMMNPVLEELALHYGSAIDFFKIDTEATPELSALFEVRGIPSLLFISPNEEPAMSSGFAPREKLEQAIKEIFHI